MSLDIRDAIVAAIKANAGLYALCGDRIFSTYAPVGTDVQTGLPTGVQAGDLWVVFHLIDDPGEEAHDGNQNLEHPRFQFDLSCTDKATLDQASTIFKREFSGLEFLFVVGAETFSLTWLHEGATEDFEEALNRIYINKTDKIIWASTLSST